MVDNSPILTTSAPHVSIVVPVNNEAENLAPLLAEIEPVLAGGDTFEVIFVDDGSTDDSAAILTDLMASRPWLRQITHDAASGKAAALRSGVRVARAGLVVILDGDGQNDPRDIPALVDMLQSEGERIGLVNSVRIGRKDTTSKRLQSRIANRVRAAILKDGTRDSVSGTQGVSTRRVPGIAVLRWVASIHAGAGSSRRVGAAAGRGHRPPAPSWTHSLRNVEPALGRALRSLRSVVAHPPP